MPPAPPTPAAAPGHSHGAADADGALWKRLCAGDEQAMVALYRQLGGALVRFVERLCGSRALAEDVLHDVFLAVMVRARPAGSQEGFRPGRGSLRAYLFGIARNTGLRRLRDLRPPPPGGADAGYAQRQDDDEQAVRAALAGLDPVFREVVLLCDLEGLRYDEAAAVLAVPVGTVRSRLARARARMAQQLTDEMVFSPPPVRKEAR